MMIYMYNLTLPYPLCIEADIKQEMERNENKFWVEKSV